MPKTLLLACSFWIAASSAQAELDCAQCRAMCRANKKSSYTEDISPKKSTDLVHKNDDAHVLFEKAIALDPAFGGKSAEGAASFYKKAVLLDPSNAQYRNYLAAALVRSGLLDEAIYNLKQASELEPSQPKYILNLGYAYHRQGDEVLALFHYLRALALDPTSVRARVFTAHALETLGKKDEALVEFRRVLEQDPTQVAAARAVKRLSH